MVALLKSSLMLEGSGSSVEDVTEGARRATVETSSRASPPDPELLLTTPAGTATSPDVDQMPIEIAAEDVKRAPGSLFLALVRNRQIRAEVEEFEKIRRSGRVRGQLPPG
jgi:hypothetical protein